MKDYLEELNSSRLRAYRECPRDIEEHCGSEERVLGGGYGYRQILELVQNGADAILEAREEGLAMPEGSRVEVLLAGDRLYVANTGAPLSEGGLKALVSSDLSPKRGNQIGRFGLGFKSLLRLKGVIDIFSGERDVIRFDPEECRSTLQEQFAVEKAPSLRLAWYFDRSELDIDPVISELSWAETIVRVEIGASDFVPRLKQEIRGFPREFLLFLTHAIELRLDDGDPDPLELRVLADGDCRTLYDGSREARWRVFSREVEVKSEKARADATHIHARDRVPLSWAMPLDGRLEAGRFWAFFPTHTPTFLPGILNAPWKLNDDRNNIIGGEWNSTLMKEAGKLVVESLPKLSTEEDPALPVDAFPRKMDRADEDAAPLVEQIWDHLDEAAVIPDCRGVLKPARKLWRHPRDSESIAHEWRKIAGKKSRSRFVHPTCLVRQRGRRLAVLAERIESSPDWESCYRNLEKRSLASWFDEIASADLEDSVAVLKLSEMVKEDCKTPVWNLSRPKLKIIPTDQAELKEPGEVVIAPERVSIPGKFSVDATLCEEPEARRILTSVLRVKEENDEVWEIALEEALSSIFGAIDDSGWELFWNRLMAASEAIRAEFVEKNRKRIHVRRNDGVWVKSGHALLPGEIVNRLDKSNTAVLVDLEFHAGTQQLLESIGFRMTPDREVEYGDCGCALGKWLDLCRDRYKRSFRNSARRNYLRPSSFRMPKGWRFLKRLSGAANARLTDHFLSQWETPFFQFGVPIGHATKKEYPTLTVTHPFRWLLAQFGRIQYGGKTVSLGDLVDRRHLSVMKRLPGWAELFLKLEWLAEERDGPIERTNQFLETWWALIEIIATPEAICDQDLCDLWKGAGADGVVPPLLSTNRGEVEIEEIYITGSTDLARRTRSQNRVVIALDEETFDLWLREGARDLSEVIETKWEEELAPKTLLLDVFPELTAVIAEEFRTVATCQAVQGLRLFLENEDQPIQCLNWEDALIFDGIEMSKLSRAKRLALLVEEMDAAGWLETSIADALGILGDHNVEARRAAIAAEETLAGRVLAIVGGREEPLLELLGDLAEANFLFGCDKLQLAELCLALNGPATLSLLREALKEEGLNPPGRWGTTEAQAFVTSLGFPPEFASSSSTRREPEEWIPGPIDLPELHDFQKEVFEGIESLAASEHNRRRAVVSLPTGGGKTRVTVQAAVSLILVPEGEKRSVIWVAQTDELCEQAVQAFRQVWLNLGEKGTDLRIVRLWGGNPNPAPQDSDKPLVIVASIQTLNSRIGAAGLDWLQNPGMLVVDECHHAITRSYSDLLRWLDADSFRVREAENEEPMIIGLSATPFRVDDDESRRLAKRFDNLWLPENQAELHTRLRRDKVLSEVVYEGLESGAGLLDREERQLSNYWDQRDGLEFDRLIETINQRLAGDEERNERMVDFLRDVSERSILLFSNSVAHAEEMAARLNLNGVSAAAISGSTPRTSRRYFLELFQRGEIRVLCNHSVLTTGFDAPKTDLVLVARQVFSAVSYMQMVGRGLRGERNGGTPSCRIVTVVDNLGRFQNRHPFNYCQRYFSSQVDSNS